MTITGVCGKAHFLVYFSSEELALLSNCLNELVNGFGIGGHEESLGVTADRISELLFAFHGAASGTAGAIRLGRDDLAALAGVVRLVVSELGLEFSIRTGFSTTEAQMLVREVEASTAG